MILSFTYSFINTLQKMLNISQSSALHSVSLGYLKVFLHCCGSASCLLQFLSFSIWPGVMRGWMLRELSIVVTMSSIPSRQENEVPTVTFPLVGPQKALKWSGEQSCKEIQEIPSGLTGVCNKQSVSFPFKADLGLGDHLSYRGTEHPEGKQLLWLNFEISKGSHEFDLEQKW